MGLESGNYINDLVATNPTSTDPKSAGDDHLRLIKSVLQNTFAGFPGAVLATGTEAAGATANDYVVTITPAPTAYSKSLLVAFVATHDNTGAATLQVAGLAAAPLVDALGAPLLAGAVMVRSFVIAAYDGSEFICLSAQGLQYRPTPPTGDVSTRIATTAFVAQAAFSATLPAQPGGPTPYALISQNGLVSWGGLSDLPLYAIGMI